MTAPRIPIVVGAPRLLKATCPTCQTTAGVLTAETGPVLIRHERRWTDTQGQKQRCKQDYIATANRHTLTVELEPVDGPDQANAQLLRAAERWMLERAREISLAIARATRQPLEITAYARAAG